MSFILEALKKADQNRTLSSVPDMHTAHQQPQSPDPLRFSVWPYAIAVLLFVNAGVIGWWLQPWTEDKKAQTIPQATEKKVVTPKSPKAPAPPVKAKKKSVVKKPVPTKRSIDKKPAVAKRSSEKKSTVVKRSAAKKQPAVTSKKKTSAASVAKRTPAAPVKKRTASTPPKAKRVADIRKSQTAAAKGKKLDPKKKIALKSQAKTTKAPAPKVVSKAKPLSQPKPKAKTPAESFPAPPPAKKTAKVAKAKSQTASDKQVERVLSKALAEIEKKVAKKPPPSFPEPVKKAAKKQPAKSPIVRRSHKESVEQFAKANKIQAQKKMPPPPAKRVTLPPSSAKVTHAATSDKFTDKDIARDFQTKGEKEREKKELSRIPYVHQLPPDVQAALPDFHISFHSYSNRPSARLVSINGKIMREGQTIEGIELERITPDGVVLLYKSRRFRVDV